MQPLDVARLVARIPLTISERLNLHRTGLKEVSELGALKHARTPQFVALMISRIVELARSPRVGATWSCGITRLSEFKIVSAPKLDRLYAGNNNLSDLDDVWRI